MGAAGKEAFTRTPECFVSSLRRRSRRNTAEAASSQVVGMALSWSPSVERGPSGVPSGVSALPAPAAPAQTLFSRAVPKTSYPPPASFSEDRAGALTRASARNSC